MSFSILILTLNEEICLPDCLRSLQWCDDIVVLDSFSGDKTEQIARGAGARFFQRKFDNFASQRNWGLNEINFKYPWVFHLDADERFTGELLDECKATMNDDKYDGYFVPSKMMFMGRWLKHSASYPAYQMRFARRGKINFIQHGHGQRESAAERVGYLVHPIIHHSFEKGLADWWEKHNRYSTDEAAQALREIEAEQVKFGALFTGDPIRRRRAMKRLSMSLPFRPWLKFAYLYLIRLGFLEGAPGLTYCSMLAIYEYMITLKMRELRRRKLGLPL
ncbi:glycosyltransferase family 2 protein [Candidatus Sumerlaeota bacterium]|nr:glycosyltransferase family 2 protein [Candidatus Sumerlaeota bacterium]